MKKTVSFYYTLVCAILTLATMLFVSCAGGTSSADGDVGYLSFGSSRAEYAGNSGNGGGQGTSNGIRLSDIYCTAENLTSLTLKGTRNGKTTTLYTWSTYGEIPGTAVPVQAGSWTFVLSGEASPAGATVSLLFTSEQEAVITAGEDTSVTFTMIYNGVPASEAQTGDIILTNRRAINPSAAAFFASSTYPREAVAFTYGGSIYGISTTDIGGSVGYSGALSTLGTLNSSSTYSDWELPTIAICSSINQVYGSISATFATFDQLPTMIWTSNLRDGTNHYMYHLANGNSHTPNDDNDSCAAIFVRRYN